MTLPLTEPRRLTRQEIDQIKENFVQKCFAELDEVLPNITIGQIDQIKVNYTLTFDRPESRPEQSYEKTIYID